ncbi:MAG: prepilin-type N-terminal cleavage/methylation domain-containing protein [Phycisphaerae bacterium]|nr:prepilin-type N-terminal cleavage/methylation domain-containing protein [Phycisphaerae bacterium]MDW8260920.1 prepilin-type N-terminal cleavage/methylation domain-containing protein [Phycisphaerales bacterium]
MPTPRRHVRAGFTLVEILVVVVILGLVSAVIIPQIGSRDDLRCAAAARVVMSDLIYAQNLAITQQQKRFVRFGTNQYGIYTSATAATPITHPVNKTPYLMTFGASGSAGLRNAAIESRSFDGSPTLVFDELGAPHKYDALTGTTTPLSTAGQVVLVSGRYRLKILIEPFTGEVSVVQE